MSKRNRVGRCSGVVRWLAAGRYPIGQGVGVNASVVRNWVNYTTAGVSGARAVWEVIQAFDHNATCCPQWPKDGQFRAPTTGEMRSMAWQAICGGANGIVFYSFFEMLKPNTLNLTFEQQWSHVSTVAGEIAPHTATLLGEPAPPPADPLASPWKTTRAHWLGTDVGGGGGPVGTAPKVYMLFAVSDGNGGGRTGFKLRWPIDTVAVLAAGSATKVARTIQVHGTDTFYDDIAPLGFTAYRVQLARAP